MIVEDDEITRDMLRKSLESNNFKVKSAVNGKEALEKIKIAKPGLIILDLMMPEMDGIQACSQLKEISSLSNTIIIFLSARNEDFTQIAAFDAGGDDYVSKPVKPKILLKKINSILKRLRLSNTENHVIDLGEIIINRNTYSVTHNEKVLTLPRKEFELFYLLASKPGNVFTRDEIMGKVWGSEIIVGDRTIDVHIRKLREKIGDSYFKTIKGVGYKFTQ